MNKWSLLMSGAIAIGCFAMVPASSPFRIISKYEAAQLVAGDGSFEVGECAYADGGSAHWCSSGCTSSLTLNPNSTAQKATASDNCSLSNAGCGKRGKSPVACNSGA
jgi:hypothetical protein